MDYTLEKEKIDYIFGFQGLYVRAINDGGNSAIDHTYMKKGEQTYTLGARVGISIAKQHELTFNYTGVSSMGRFISPREWGKERLYTTMSRDALEGYGGAQSFVLKYGYSTKNKVYSLKLGAGYINQPDITDYRLNKYKLDDYYHFLIDNSFKFNNLLDGFTMRLLAIYKKEAFPGSMTESQRVNKVNMMNLSLILEYKL